MQSGLTEGLTGQTLTHCQSVTRHSSPTSLLSRKTPGLKPILSTSHVGQSNCFYPTRHVLRAELHAAHAVAPHRPQHTVTFVPLCGQLLFWQLEQRVLAGCRSRESWGEGREREWREFSVALPVKFMGGRQTSTYVQLHKLVAYASTFLSLSLSPFIPHSLTTLTMRR